MGEVLLARRRGVHGFERLVAIKTIRADLQDRKEIETMFLDEARLMARLDHPVICQVHDFGQQDDVLYLAMEYVAGISFSELIRRRPPPLIAARAIAEACRGLHVAHELVDMQGISLDVVHRDISPANLMLSFAGRVKILDFGIAWTKARMTPKTEYGSLRGKPPNMSPEQLKGETLDRRTDVFAASLVLHELLTGQRLFKGTSAYAVALAMANDPIPPPSEVAGPLPVGLDEAVLRGLERSIAKRFPTALAMAEALEKVCAAIDAPAIEQYAHDELIGLKVRHRRRVKEALAAIAASDVGEIDTIETAPVPGADVLVVEELREQPLGGTVSQARLPKEPARSQGAIPTVDLGLPFTPSGSGVEQRGAMQAADFAPTNDQLSVAGAPSRRWLIVVLSLMLIGATAATVFLLKTDSGSKHTAAGVALDQGVARDQDTARDQSAQPADAAADHIPPPDARIADIQRPDSKRPARRPRQRRKPTRKTPLISKKPPKVAPAPKAFGKLTIGATPYAIVRLDGKEIGATPIFGRRIAAGTHVVVLLHPDTRAVRLKKTIVVGKDKTVHVIAR
jgi:hypothetical protein